MTPEFPIPKKVLIYTARLTQTSTNAPTATVLQDTIGGTWTRQEAGKYRYTKIGAFKNLKSWSTGLGNDPTSTSLTIERITDDYMLLSCRSLTNFSTFLDDALYETAIEIRSYNKTITT